MFVFPGHPAYLQAAARDLGASAAVADAARQQPAISQIASLVGQATAAPKPHPDTVRKVCELRDGLRVAALAAERMAALIEPEPTPTTTPTTTPTPSELPTKPSKAR